MTENTYLIFMAVHAAAVMSPGPDTLLIVRNSLAGGPRAGFLTTLGILLASFVIVLLVLNGLALVLRAHPGILSAIRYLGAGYLIYVGYRCISSQGIDGFKEVQELKGGDSARFIEGFVTNLSNPKAMLYFVSILSQFVTPGMSMTDRLGFIGIVQGIPLVWFSLLSLSVSQPIVRGRICRFSKRLDQGMALLFFVIAGKLITSS